MKPRYLYPKDIMQTLLPMCLTENCSSILPTTGKLVLPSMMMVVTSR